MPIELTLLGATLVLALVQIMIAGQLRTRQYGTKWNAGPRDEAQPPLDPLPARLVRAQANLFETLPLSSARCSPASSPTASAPRRRSARISISGAASSMSRSMRLECRMSAPWCGWWRPRVCC